MIPLRSLHTVLLVCSIFLLPVRVEASIVISEIMYDVEGTDTDREWVELYNGGAETIDVSKWKINDGSNHVLSEPPKNGGQGTRSIASGGYLILASDATRFLAEHPILGGVVDTTLSLNNTSEIISLIDADGAMVDTATFSKETGAAGDGNSLQRQGSTWVAGSPTPGRENVMGLTLNKTIPNTATSDLSNQMPKTAPKTATQTQKREDTHATLQLQAPTFTIVGNPVVFGIAVAENLDMQLNDANTAWNFGDGTTSNGRETEHTYSRSGTYVVVATVVVDGKEQTLRTTIVAEPSAILITQVEPGATGFMILKNVSSRDADLSHWRLTADSVSFSLPSGTIILPNAEVVFSAAATGLSVRDILSTTLLLPSGAEAARFDGKVEATQTKKLLREYAAPERTVTPVYSEKTESRSMAEAPSSEGSVMQISEPDVVPDEHAVTTRAAAIESGFFSGKIVPWLASLVALILVAFGAVLALRQSEAASVRVGEQAEDYTIIDEE